MLQKTSTLDKNHGPLHFASVESQRDWENTELSVCRLVIIYSVTVA